MQIEMRAVDQIRPYDRNPRKNDAAVDAVARSIREFGARQPIVVDEHGTIVVGHTRWRAAKQLGLAEFPVHVAVGLSPEKARAYRIADNQTATIAEWDMELLPVELAELKDLGVDIAGLGFDDDELKRLQEWTYRYRDGGIPALTPGKAPGNKSLLPPEQHEAFRQRIIDGPRESDGVCTLRGKDACRILREEFGVVYKVGSVYDLMHRLGLSCLKPRPRHEQSDPEAMRKFTQESAPLLSAPSRRPSSPAADASA